MLNLTTHCIQCKNNNNELNISTVQLICKNQVCWCCLRELRRHSNRFACPYCNRSHNIGKYVETDNSAIVETWPFCFDDSIFTAHDVSDEIMFNFDQSQLLDNCNTWIQELSNVVMNDSNKGRLAILHLNVNSVREKMCNIDRIPYNHNHFFTVMVVCCGCHIHNRQPHFSVVTIDDLLQQPTLSVVRTDNWQLTTEFLGLR